MSTVNCQLCGDAGMFTSFPTVESYCLVAGPSSVLKDRDKSDF